MPPVLQHEPSEQVINLLLNYRDKRKQETGSHRNHSWMLPMALREQLMQQLCAEYDIPLPRFEYCRDPFQFKSTGRSANYQRDLVQSIRTPIFGKHVLWLFYWHYMWVQYRLEPDSVPLESDCQEPGEVFAHCYWRLLYPRLRE